MKQYFRPIPCTDPARPALGLPLAGGPCWVAQIEVLSRGAPPQIIPIADAPADIVQAITSPRASVAGLQMDQPRLMGVLNLTPDSFSSDGLSDAPDRALTTGLQMVRDGADIIDIGGESTRPGAVTIEPDHEIDRTEPIIRALRAQIETPISIDTRKTKVARAALDAGANLVNDVSGFTYDPSLASFCAARNAPVCVMHAQGDPTTMQADPQYENVLLDVYDFLAAQIETLKTAGVQRRQILVDPGIGFGKTQDHNLALLRRISLFHSLGCPILLGVSRKRFIGTLGQAPAANTRAPGSIAVGLAALMQGVQILRVHDIAMTKQAIRLHNAVTSRDQNG